jgi:hypothetical protein
MTNGNMSTLVSIYRNAMTRLFSSKYIVVTNTVSFGLLMGFADCAVQTIERQIADKEERKSRRHDWARTGNSALYFLFKCMSIESFKTENNSASVHLSAASQQLITHKPEARLCPLN